MCVPPHAAVEDCKFRPHIVHFLTLVTVVHTSTCWIVYNRILHGNSSGRQVYAHAKVHS